MPGSHHDVSTTYSSHSNMSRVGSTCRSVMDVCSMSLQYMLHASDEETDFSETLRQDFAQL